MSNAVIFKVMRAFSLMTVALAVASTAFATMQIPDRAIHDGKEYELETFGIGYLMESYFKEHPDKHPRGGTISTALYRGYVATCEVKDRQLFLKDIVIDSGDRDTAKDGEYRSLWELTRWKSVMSQVFPDKKPPKMDWVSGLLVLKHPFKVGVVEEGRKEYIVWEIDKGDIKKEVPFTERQAYEEFKTRQFEAFKKTDGYEKAVAKRKERGAPEENIDSSLRYFITLYTSKILFDTETPEAETPKSPDASK